MDVVVGSSVPRAGSSWEAAGTFRPLWVHHSLDTEGQWKKSCSSTCFCFAIFLSFLDRFLSKSLD